MSVVIASGVFGAGMQFFDANGKPLNQGILNTYAAGTTTPVATFTTSLGNVANPPSITLGVDGRPPNEIWITAGTTVRFDLLDSLNNLIKTYDNIPGTNDISGIAEWIATNLTPVFISSTSFSLTGNQTTLLPNGMRIKTANTGGTMYGKVVSSSYAAVPNTTTFVIANDVNAALDSGLSAVAYSILAPVNPSLDSDYVLRKANLVTSAGVTNIWAVSGDLLHITAGSVTTITSFGTAFYAGNERTVIADAAFTVSHSSAIQCLASANIAALAGDRFVVRADTTTVANIVEYSRATGKALLETFSTATAPITVSGASISVSIASKADQQNASSAAVVVTPLHQQDHDSASKCWVMADTNGGSSASYNVSSITDAGTGLITVNFSTSFATANYCALVNIASDATLIDHQINSGTFSSAACEFRCINTGGAGTDPNHWFAAFFGRQ